MNCDSENILRAYEDGEVDAAGRAEIEIHLADCKSCGKRLLEMRATSAAVNARLSALDAGVGEVGVDAHLALAQFKARHEARVTQDARVKKPAAISPMFDRRWRPAWITAMAATIILGALAFPSGLILVN